MVKHAAAAVLMFGFGFALVPLYDIFCEITGLNGKVTEQVEKFDYVIDESRTVRIQFIASNNAEMPWNFAPLQDQLSINPGAWNQVGFWVENNTDKFMVSQAVPSITPSEAAQYVKKSECFCFNQQPLPAGESKQMNLVFTISPDLPKEIETISMVYTLFDSTEFAESADLAMVK